MPSVSVDKSDKEWFDEFKGSRNQAEAFSEMVKIVKAFDGEPVDHDLLAEKLSKTLIPQTEIAAYRGVTDALDD